MNPGSPAWRAGVLVQARRPPQCFGPYRFVGLDGFIILFFVL